MSADDDTKPQGPGRQAGNDNAGSEPADDVAALKAENAALKDRALRALAEAENIRKRAERERDETRQYAVARFARELLNVADNLDRALSSVPAEALANADEAVKAVIGGVEATARELKAILARHGVQRIEAQGSRFDPHLHQAIAEVPASGQEPGTVINVVQEGYVIGERLLRPAMVTVAKAGGGVPKSNGSSGENLDRNV